MRNLFYFFTIILVLALVALPVFAQDSVGPVVEETAVVVPYGTVDAGVQQQAETLFQNLITLLWNAAYLPFAAPMVTILVALSKRLPFNISSPAWVLTWTIVLWVAYLAATQIGYANQFETTVTSLATIGAALLGITATSVGAGSIYNVAKSNNIAVIGTPQSKFNSPTGEKVLVSEAA